MANGLLGMFRQGVMPGDQPALGGVFGKKPSAANGLLGMDPMTWLQISGALAQGAEQDSWGVGLGGVGNVLQNRQLMQQQDQDRRADQGYRGWQMKQSERQAEIERAEAERIQQFREEQARIQNEQFDRNYSLDERRTAVAERAPTTGTDSFRPITAEERAAYGIAGDQPYAMNLRTGRPVSVGGTRTQEWTQGQRTGSSYVANMTDAYNRAIRMMEGGFDPRGVVSGRPRWTMSPQGRDFYRAVRDYAEGELRAETGAAATQDEIERKLEQLMAGANEDPSNVARIFDRMRTRIGAMSAAQGGAFEALYPDQSARELPQSYRDLLDQPSPGGATTRPRVTTGGDQNIPPPPPGWDPEDWLFLTPQERAELLGG